MTLLLATNWLVVDFCYYGLSLHSGITHAITNSTHQSISLAISSSTLCCLLLLRCPSSSSSVAQMPAVVLGMVGMDWIGRVSLLVTCQLIGGVRWDLHCITPL